MSIFISNILNKLSEKFWIIIAISAGCFFTPIGFGVASLLIRSSHLSYSSGDTTINIGQAKKISNNSKYSNQVLEKRLQLVERDVDCLNTNDQNCLNRLENSLEQLIPTAHEAINNSTELTKVVEKTIN